MSAARVALGAVGLAGFALHAVNHVRRGHPSEVLWACNAGSLLVAGGALAGAPRLIAVGACWLAYGVPLWLLDLATGGKLVPTTFGTHALGPVVAAYALHELGWPRGAWATAWIVSLALLAASRLLGDRAVNVNLVFRVAEGWEGRFRSHPRYVAMLWLGSGAVYFTLEALVTLLPALG